MNRNNLPPGTPRPSPPPPQPKPPTHPPDRDGWQAADTFTWFACAAFFVVALALIAWAATR